MVERRVGRLRGVIQGVGFRPFVARLAEDLSLAGHVRNSADQVEIEVEGAPTALDQFLHRLLTELPAAARVDDMDWHTAAPIGEALFHIAASQRTETTAALGIPPDLAVCEDCLAEVANPSARRHNYPFTNCTECGPRFTITECSPYDRVRTTMASFSMCQSCRSEYDDPRDRRYHAQPIACPACGPLLRLTTAGGEALSAGPQALDDASTALLRGDILALKGLGGYQLLVRADDAAAVERLRQRKRREAKPLALLVADLAAARALARIDDEHARALQHPAAPIVLLPARGGGVVAAVAPNQRRLGIMLPASPLHALIAQNAGVPLVCTSGNLHDEPICIDDDDALRRLGDIADCFLTHNRTILRRADDSVVHVACGRMRVLRAARGLTPTSLPLSMAGAPVLALGGHLKHAPVLAANRRAIVWPHVGNLHSPAARDAMLAAIVDLEAFGGVRASTLATDYHPDYATTLWANSSGRRVLHVQHHHAHIASVMAEHHVDAALGFAWDGMGLGVSRTCLDSACLDGSTRAEAWGGETMAVDRQGARRVACLHPFPLPGGDAAARDGRRALAGLCAAAGLEPPADHPQVHRFMSLAAAPRLTGSTTSVGRLFDGVAALTRVAMTSSFEGQAAMALEAIAEPDAAPYRFDVRDGTIDWRPMLSTMLQERESAVRVASRFHATLTAMIVHVARSNNAPVVALAGGCFQNQLLLRQSLAALEDDGVTAVAAERVPSGDGGLALGQAWIVSSRSRACA